MTPDEHILDRLDAYLDGELSPDGGARVAAHVAGCASCRVRGGGLPLQAESPAAAAAETPRNSRREESFMVALLNVQGRDDPPARNHKKNPRPRVPGRGPI